MPSETQATSRAPRRGWAAALPAAHCFLLTLAYAASLARALMRLDLSWDIWWYHLPAALRRLGYDNFTAEPAVEAVIRGFPPLPHLVQAGLIAATNRIESAGAVNLVGLALATAALAALFRRRLALRWLLTAFLALPTLNLQLGRGYVDLWCAAMVLLCFGAYLALALGAGPLRWSLAAFVAGATAAALSKYTTWPLVLVVGAFWVHGVWRRTRERRLSAREACAWALAAALGVAAWPVRNVIVNGSPVYPVTTGMTHEVTFAHQLRDTPAPVRFWYSALELSRLAPTDERFAWSIDATSPLREQSYHYRLGGFFFLTTLTLLGLLLYGMITRILPRGPSWCVVALVLVAMSTPISHELRYWMAAPMCAALLLTVRLAAFPALPRRLGQALLVVAMVYVCDHVGTLRHLEPLSVADLAPDDARRFWREHASESGSARVFPVAGRSPWTVFFTGPTLREFRIRAVE